MFIHAFALLLSVPSDTIVVGHSKLNAALHVGSDTTEVYMERDGKRQLVNTGVEKVLKTSDGYVVVFEGQSRRGVSIDSVTISGSTLAPIRHVEAFGKDGATLAFRAGRLTGTKTDSTGTHPVDIAVPANRFDFSVLTHITRSLPASAGYEAVILTYDVAPMKERSVTYKVVGQDHITWKGADVNAWKTVTDFGTHQVTRWMDPKSHRDLQWEIVAPNMHMIGVTK
ncbi:MAG TPA: hypothetical protein VM076_25815 [Gemmatimonadaceae bacterium]|nr:hypothetical protein [Gemmatimonadaceae bacterium]